jgi:Queuosine biosynthesis protein QueC
LAAHLADGEAVAISVETNGRMQHVQRQVLDSLRVMSGRNCMPLSYRVSVGAASIESSQRSRGLLFLGVGIATSWALRQDQLQVFENGIGAINLPYLRSQFGSQATRSMHPRTLRLIEDLASAVSLRPFRISAPALNETKAQAARKTPLAAGPALARTVSYDTGFSARAAGPCGTCTSCLLRRQALYAAGRTDLDAAASYRVSSPEDSFTFQAMKWQVVRLRACLDRPEPWAGLVSEFPEVLDTAPLAPAEVISLYRSYVREWEGLDGVSEIGGQLGRQGRAAL